MPKSTSIVTDFKTGALIFSPDLSAPRPLAQPVPLAQPLPFGQPRRLCTPHQSEDRPLNGPRALPPLRQRP